MRNKLSEFFDDGLNSSGIKFKTNGEFAMSVVKGTLYSFGNDAREE